MPMGSFQRSCKDSRRHVYRSGLHHTTLGFKLLLGEIRRRISNTCATWRN